MFVYVCLRIHEDINKEASRSNKTYVGGYKQHTTIAITGSEFLRDVLNIPFNRSSALLQQFGKVIFFESSSTWYRSLSDVPWEAEDIPWQKSHLTLDAWLRSFFFCLTPHVLAIFYYPPILAALRISFLRGCWRSYRALSVLQIVVISVKFIFWRTRYET